MLVPQSGNSLSAFEFVIYLFVHTNTLNRHSITHQDDHHKDQSGQLSSSHLILDVTKEYHLYYLLCMPFFRSLACFSFSPLPAMLAHSLCLLISLLSLLTLLITSTTYVFVMDSPHPDTYHRSTTYVASMMSDLASISPPLLPQPLPGPGLISPVYS